MQLLKENGLSAFNVSHLHRNISLFKYTLSPKNYCNYTVTNYRGEQVSARRPMGGGGTV